MNLPVILRRLARAEFDDAADWYESRKAGQGTAFLAAVRGVLVELGSRPEAHQRPLRLPGVRHRVLVELGSRPEAHPKVYGDVREALVARYPYAIYYRPGSDQITVLAVFHTSRDPAEWQGRASD